MQLKIKSALQGVSDLPLFCLRAGFVSFLAVAAVGLNLHISPPPPTPLVTQNETMELLEAFLASQWAENGCWKNVCIILGTFADEDEDSILQAWRQNPLVDHTNPAFGMN